MQKLVLIVVLACLISACDNAEIKTEQKAALTCETVKNIESSKESQAFADKCFKQGSYSKSSGMKW